MNTEHLTDSERAMWARAAAYYVPITAAGYYAIRDAQGEPIAATQVVAILNEVPVLLTTIAELREQRNAAFAKIEAARNYLMQVEGGITVYREVCESVFEALGYRKDGLREESE